MRLPARMWFRSPGGYAALMVETTHPLGYTRIGEAPYAGTGTRGILIAVRKSATITTSAVVREQPAIVVMVAAAIRYTPAFLG